MVICNHIQTCPVVILNLMDGHGAWSFPSPFILHLCLSTIKQFVNSFLTYISSCSGLQISLVLGSDGRNRCLTIFCCMLAGGIR